MSREHPYAYCVHPDAVLMGGFDMLCELMEDGLMRQWPSRNNFGLLGSNDKYELWLWGNRAKVRRIADYLDMHLGHKGTIERMDTR
jgi:hypothetical protein